MSESKNQDVNIALEKKKREIVKRGRAQKLVYINIKYTKAEKASSIRLI